MDLEDKAQESPPIDLAGQLVESQYRLKSTELIPADELGDDEFPQYGDFAEAVERSPVDGTERGEKYIEVTADLASFLVEQGVATDEWFQVVSHEQDPDGRHCYDVRVIDQS